MSVVAVERWGGDTVETMKSKEIRLFGYSWCSIARCDEERGYSSTESPSCIPPVGSLRATSADVKFKSLAPNLRVHPADLGVRGALLLTHDFPTAPLPTCQVQLRLPNVLSQRVGSYVWPEKYTQRSIIFSLQHTQNTPSQCNLAPSTVLTAPQPLLESVGFSWRSFTYPSRVPPLSIPPT